MKGKIGRVIALLTAVALTLCGCHSLVEDDSVQKTIYASFFPIYLLAREVISDVPGMTLKCLVQSQDGCLRSYQLSDWDSAVIMSADALIIGGRGLESFESTVTSLGAQGPSVVVAMDALELTGQDTAATRGDELESHLDGANPWLFLSPEGASQIMESIAANMIYLDPAYEGMYAENLINAQQRMDELLINMTGEISGVQVEPVGLMHEGLSYFADCLGLYVGAVVDREPGVELIESELDSAIESLEAGGVRVVLLEKQAPSAMVDTLTQAGFSVARIDTFSTYPTGSIDDGYYYDAMLENALAVKNAFEQAAR